MIKQLVLVCWLSFLTAGFAQSGADNYRVYKSLEEALEAHPDSVFYLDLSGERLTELPKEVLTFKNLISLDLSRNKISTLPDSMEFLNLEVLNLTKNKLTVFPKAICAQTKLKQLFLGKNKLESLPPCISQLQELVVLDAWFNLIAELPETMSEMRRLKSLDLRGMNYSEEQQKKWQAMMPWVKIEYDMGCDCGL